MIHTLGNNVMVYPTLGHGFDTFFVCWCSHSRNFGVEPTSMPHYIHMYIRIYITIVKFANKFIFIGIQVYCTDNLFFLGAEKSILFLFLFVLLILNIYS